MLLSTPLVICLSLIFPLLSCAIFQSCSLYHGYRAPRCRLPVIEEKNHASDGSYESTKEGTVFRRTRIQRKSLLRVRIHVGWGLINSNDTGLTATAAGAACDACPPAASLGTRTTLDSWNWGTCASWRDSNLRPHATHCRWHVGSLAAFAAPHSLSRLEALARLRFRARRLRELARSTLFGSVWL